MPSSPQSLREAIEQKRTGALDLFDRDASDKQKHAFYLRRLRDGRASLLETIQRMELDASAPLMELFKRITVALAHGIAGAPVDAAMKDIHQEARYLRLSFTAQLGWPANIQNTAAGECLKVLYRISLAMPAGHRLIHDTSQTPPVFMRHPVTKATWCHEAGLHAWEYASYWSCYRTQLSQQSPPPENGNWFERRAHKKFFEQLHQTCRNESAAAGQAYRQATTEDLLRCCDHP